MLSWIAYWLGLTDASGAPYLFWSGFGADLGELALFVPMIVFVRHHTCHTDRCWRLGHAVEGTVLCRRHRFGR